MANIFVGYHESLLMNALDTLPIGHFWYVDDCLAILETKDLALDSVCLLNGMHPIEETHRIKCQAYFKYFHSGCLFWM